MQKSVVTYSTKMEENNRTQIIKLDHWNRLTDKSHWIVVTYLFINMMFFQSWGENQNKKANSSLDCSFASIVLNCSWTLIFACVDSNKDGISFVTMMLWKSIVHVFATLWCYTLINRISITQKTESKSNKFIDEELSPHFPWQQGMSFLCTNNIWDLQIA